MFLELLVIFVLAPEETTIKSHSYSVPTGVSKKSLVKSSIMFECRA